jgi:hypothetical protein
MCMFVYMCIQMLQQSKGVKLAQPGVWEPAAKKGLAARNLVTIGGDGGSSKTVGSHSRQRLPIESQCPGPQGANRAPQEARWTL